MPEILTLIGVLVVSLFLKWAYDAGYKRGFDQRWNSEIEDFSKKVAKKYDETISEKE